MRPVRAKCRAANGARQHAAKGFIFAGKCDRSGQVAGNIMSKARAGKHGRDRMGHRFSQHIRHQFQAVLLNAFRAENDRCAWTNILGGLCEALAHMLGGDDGKNCICLC